MSRFNENMLNPIDIVVPLHANPDREIDVSGDLIRVKTQSGSFYYFDGISHSPLFYDSARIYNITSDLSGNTIYVDLYGNNDAIAIYRLNLQGVVTWGNRNITLDHLSENNTTTIEDTTATEGATTYTDNKNSVNLFSGSIIRRTNTRL